MAGTKGDIARSSSALAEPNLDSEATLVLWANQSASVYLLDYGTGDASERCPLRLTDLGSFPSSCRCSVPSGCLDGEAGLSLVVSS